MTMKLFMLLLGCKPIGRHTEQHDVFFGLAESVKDLIPSLRNFWLEANEKLHVDAWREVNFVDGFRITITEKKTSTVAQGERLFFINLGGYRQGIFDEPHYKMLTVQKDLAHAIQKAKTTQFYQDIQFEGANSHVDDKYGVDVDDIFEIEDILPEDQRAKYRLLISKSDEAHQDIVQLGYFKLNKLP